MIKHKFAEKVFYFKGLGGRGKSTAMDMLRALYNSSACKSYNPVAPKMGEEVAFVGTQIVFNDDLADGAQNIDVIRPAATGNIINVRPLYQQAKTYVPYATQIYSSNFPITWKGRNGGNSAAQDRVFILEFKGKKFRGTQDATKFVDEDLFKNETFMDVFASACAWKIVDLIEEGFNDVASALSNSGDLHENDVVQMFINEFKENKGHMRTIFGESDLDNVYFVAKNGYTTITELWKYFQAWKRDGNYSYNINKSEFQAQFEYLTGIKVKNAEKITVEQIGQNRWIDLNSLIKGEK